MTATFSGAFNYAHINANGTTTIKSGPGMLGALSINTKGASSNTITIYDSTTGSGTVIAVIDSTSQVFTFPFEVNFANGLTVVVASGTAPDITISWL